MSTRRRETGRVSPTAPARRRKKLLMDLQSRDAQPLGRSLARRHPLLTVECAHHRKSARRAAGVHQRDRTLAAPSGRRPTGPFGCHRRPCSWCLPAIRVAQVEKRHADAADGPPLRVPRLLRQPGCPRAGSVLGEERRLQGVADQSRAQQNESRTNRPMNLLFRASVLLALSLSYSLVASAGESSPTREEVVAAMRPYDGPSTPGVDCSTLTGKVMCGYQGWFTAPDDGSGKGWRHYLARGQFKPGFCGIDLWPDVGELDDDEKHVTPFRHKDGHVAQVFSSHNRKSVLRHFRWMKEYDIDGVFLQRFGVETLDPKDLRHCNVVLTHCREGANRSGRCYAVMYDLSLLPAGGTRHIVEDWKLLVDRMRIGRDPKDAAYLRHGGKPVVAVWGIGFNDGRKYTLAECERLVDFLKNDQRYGGFTVLL